jgi:hypothetical protein
LERARIDLGEKFAGLDDLPFLECDTHQLSVDARLHRDGVARRDSAERVEIDVDAAFACWHCNNRRGRPAPSPRPPFGAGGSAVRDDQYQRPAPAAISRRIATIHGQRRPRGVGLGGGALGGVACDGLSVVDGVATLTGGGASFGVIVDVLMP